MCVFKSWEKQSSKHLILVQIALVISVLSLRYDAMNKHKMNSTIFINRHAFCLFSFLFGCLSCFVQTYYVYQISFQLTIWFNWFSCICETRSHWAVLAQWAHGILLYNVHIICFCTKLFFIISEFWIAELRLKQCRQLTFA